MIAAAVGSLMIQRMFIPKMVQATIYFHKYFLNIAGLDQYLIFSVQTSLDHFGPVFWVFKISRTSLVLGPSKKGTRTGTIPDL